MATPYSTTAKSTTQSTQDDARRELAETGRPSLVVALHQSQGRGRSGAGWESADRALAASLAMTAPWPLDRSGPLSLVAGLAMRTAVTDRFGVSLGCKWPNDLVDAAGAKIAGLLVETTEDTVVVGCGLNLHWPRPIEGAAGLLDHDPGPDVVVPLAEQWIDGLMTLIERGPDDWPHAEYVASCVTLGTAVQWEPDGLGVARDIAADGGLVVATASGVETIRSGAVRTVRPATLSGGSEADQE